VRPGIVTGFLGPNGAGKSTTMRMILGLDAPTSGTVTVDGKPYREHAKPLQAVGALLEARAVHTSRSAYNHLRALAATHGIANSRVDEVIDLVGLQEVARKRAGGFSLGMGQRLGIASALLADPSTLILDEPVNGLDPEGIRWMRELLRGLSAEGRTVLVSSHLLSEMQTLADDVVIVAAGRLVRQGTVPEVVSSLAGNGRVEVATPDPETLGAALQRLGAAVISDGPGRLAVTGVQADVIGQAAHDADVVLHQLRTEQPDLEDVFLQLTQGKATIR
jgi:ABC-2 type transport system ATP-binding protein